MEGSHVHVVVGETKHPMLEEHFIEWITLNTNQGIYRKQLNPAFIHIKITEQHKYNSNIGCVLIYLQGGTTNEIRM